ncbi:RibD family protein [Roseibium sp. CAU 1637]|uniref:RibD family protein n=1 Tax=Roseibium limicola TaxID=2816037 RepID=A0A939ELB8_9HYPH|nr:RibD family protein [Roseibium limicola]MBO0343922.1 RibD family protein [Roseibium limicola]
MRHVEIDDTTWNRILAVKHNGKPTPALSSMERLYGPIAVTGHPFVMAQVGQSLDGRVATPTGDARDISGADGLAHLHRCRALVDAVIVGYGTVEADDPQLSVRLAKGRSPVRVIIDCRGELTGREGLFHDGGAPIIVFQSTEAAQNPTLKAEVIRLRPSATGLSPHHILKELRQRSLQSILVEGGARTIARFINEDLINRLHVIISPIIIGSGPAGIHLPPITHLCDARRPETQVYSLGTDVLFDCVLAPSISAGSLSRAEPKDLYDQPRMSCPVD